MYHEHINVVICIVVCVFCRFPTIITIIIITILLSSSFSVLYTQYSNHCSKSIPHMDPAVYLYLPPYKKQFFLLLNNFTQTPIKKSRYEYNYYTLTT